MRAHVLTDRALARQAGRFVWLSIDTEKERNASFLEKFPIELYPTLLVIDPQREQAVFRWLGGASVRQLETLLDDGERALRPAETGAGGLLAKADRLLAAGRSKQASRTYRKAIAQAARTSPQRERAVESLLALLATTGQARDCARLARAELPAEKSAHYATLAGGGLGCALELHTEEGRSAAALFESAVGDAVRDSAIELAADDRSSLFGTLVQARRGADDEAGAQRLAEDWLRFLDAEAERAPSAEARAVFDSHRLGAALAAGVPARALPGLKQSELDFPDDYNPPARLAHAYFAAERYDEALAAAERALDRAYGPRKLRIYSIKVDVLEKKGDLAAAKATLEQALRYAATLPAAQVPDSTVRALRSRLDKIG